MASTPCPIVVVTADVEGNAARVFEAMGAGALDAVNAPRAGLAGEKPAGEVLLAKIETIRRLIGRPAAPRRRPAPEATLAANPSAPGPLVVIGASAGGPAALAAVLRGLPADFSAPIVVVQHLEAQFARSLAAWLESQIGRSVRLVREGDRPEAGKVLLAGRDRHLVLAASGRFAYALHPADCAYRPSVDVFFESVGQFWRGRVIGLLLTGMGRDGAEGLRRLRGGGHHTITQDAATSVAYGMPKAAAELRAAAEILPLGKIGPRVAALLDLEFPAHG